MNEFQLGKFLLNAFFLADHTIFFFQFIVFGECKIIVIFL